MRRKKNLTPRFDKIGDVLIRTKIDERNSNIATQKKEYLEFNEIFKNDNEVFLEIGAGFGGFAIAFAKKYPNKNILAVEVITNVLVSACESIQGENLPNLKFINIGAEYLEKYIKEKSIAGIYLNFSTPYQKNSYKNRRLTNGRFLKIYEKLLKDGAYIYQKTDDVDFFEYSLEEYQNNGWTIENKTYNLHENTPDDNIMTEYESKFVSLNKSICSVWAKKN